MFIMFCFRFAVSALPSLVDPPHQLLLAISNIRCFLNKQTNTFFQGQAVFHVQLLQ